NHRARDARAGHRRACVPPDPSAGRARRARPEDQRLTVKRYPPATRVALLVGLAACTKAESAPLYEKVPVERRDITVAATAPGVIQPLLTLSVKSKAWGEILALPAPTRDEGHEGQLLAKIDPRLPREHLPQIETRQPRSHPSHPP